ncbi:MAG: hypothetical protein HYV90_04720 [Candidatus Woesebacteria bacterium]|nr:MAG: hypothetical protein HYV90_04720 [Candidatus Woesebacteria bacterium]
MSKEFGAEGVWPCRLDVNKKLIAQGINSVVFRVNEYALKIYRDNSPIDFLNIEKLRFYNDITSRASDLAKAEKWSIKLPLPYGNKRILINPFLQVGKCDKCGYLEAWAPFITGARLDSVFFTPVHDILVDKLSGLNYKIEKELGVDGIFIAPVNVRSSGLSAFTVTDLCFDIADLAKKN